jgi:hypothetical protein
MGLVVGIVALCMVIVRVKRIRYFYQFTSCLHEIGHLMIEQRGDLLDRAYRAWGWARNWARSRQPFDVATGKPWHRWERVLKN